MKFQSLLGMVALFAALFASPGAQAQYKYIGPDGRVVYSDQPPPPNARVLEKKPLPSGTANDMPAPLAQAMKTSPVTFYTSQSCPSCNDARKMLIQRGIPYSEKTIANAEDADQFAKTINSSQLPVLVVGQVKLVAYAPDDWNNALTNAGYPATSQLPPTYRNPAPVNVAQDVTKPATPPANATGQPVAPANLPAAPAAPSGGSQPSWFKGF